ncbi:MAG: Mov34/MPN/PAD-1 family protein [Candidatus Omnitrophica bacterium]|nr:Mov34/MPN/PAD-1 family protein [Candidatus Omnitrophota bacterium]
MIYLTKEQFRDITQHAKDSYPKEACGILAGINGKVEKVYKMTNISDNPESCYFMKPEEQLKVFKEMRKIQIEMIGIYHSHSNTPAYPSQRDCELAFYPEVDYVIISLKDFDCPEIRSFKIIEGKIKEEKIIIRKNILFIDLDNSFNSQIAEAIVNNFYWQKFYSYSAGLKPSGTINPFAVEVMKEIGIDITNQKSKGLAQIKNIEFDYIINLGCQDVNPNFIQNFSNNAQQLNWNISQLRIETIEFSRKVRDEIENKIKEFFYG